MLVTDLIKFDAKADVVSLEVKRSASTAIYFIHELLHLDWMFYTYAHVVVELVGVHDVRLWQEMVIVHKLVGLFGDHRGEHCKTSNHIDATIKELVLA